jgi:hypothetical protein
MAEQRSVSTQEWGELVKSVLTSKLVSYLFEFDEEAMARSGVVAMVEEELRIFLPLKAEVQSQKPREPALESAHEKLLELMQRLFMVAQQALLNRPQADGDDRPQAGQSPDQWPPGTPPGGNRLISWHVRRMNDIGEQFMAALAELAEKRRGVYDELGLPAGIIAEPLRRHERGREAGEDSGEPHRPKQQTER